MRVSVIADVVPFVDDAAHEIGIRLPVLADDEEAGGHVFGFEYVKDARRPCGIGAVVKS